jgi:hypothetical protein
MKMSPLSKFVLAGILAVAMHAGPAQAQASRTWVSGTGNDVDPCSRTAPCKTFAGAISKTAVGGEISVLDPGGYGAVTINKSLTINGEGTLASILVTSGSAITVAAGATDKVILRNLSLNGQSGANSGVQVITGNVTIDKCEIFGFTTGFFGGMGVLINASATTYVEIKDTNISYTTHGVWVSTTSGFAVAALDNVRINGTSGQGVLTASNNAFATVNRSYISSALGAAIYTATTGSTINVNDTILTNNATAVNASASGTTVNLNNVSMFNNAAGLTMAAGATIATAGNNKAASSGALTTNGTVSTF